MSKQAVSDVQRVQEEQKRRSQNFSGLGIACFPFKTNERIKRHKLLFGTLNSGDTEIRTETADINDALLKKKES